MELIRSASRPPSLPALSDRQARILAFEPAAARQVPTDAMRDLGGPMRQLRGGGCAGAVQALLPLRRLDLRLVHAVLCAMRGTLGALCLDIPSANLFGSPLGQGHPPPEHAP
jgi:hypothetical protein